MMELSAHSISSPATTSNPYSPATAPQTNLSYSSDHTTMPLPTKSSEQSPANLQHSADQQTDKQIINKVDDQLISNDHRHTVTNFINHAIETERETDKSPVKFSEESHMKSNQPSPMDYQTNNSDIDNKHELKGYDQINRDASPTHTSDSRTDIEHDIISDKHNEDKNASDSYNQRADSDMQRHGNQHLDERSHHHLNLHRHNHHQQLQESQQRESLNGNLPHAHLELQNEQRHQLHQSQPQYHSPHHLQDHQHHHHQQQQHNLHHQLQQHHHNLGIHDHQSHLQHLDHQQYKLYPPQYPPPPNSYNNAYQSKQNTTFKPYRMNNISSNIKHEVSNDGYETSATGDSSHLTQNGNHMMANQVMMPKCEISNADDPYNFVDDEMQGSMSPHLMPPSMQQHMRVPYASPTSLIGGGGGGNIGSGNVPKLASMHGNVHAMSSSHSPALSSPPIEPKKRGRKKKQRDDTEHNQIMNGVVKQIVTKERKKHDRFNGLSEEEVSKRTLPDHMAANLDIIIIGINPGLFAAYKGHHYAGPGNHFWKCLYLSGLTHEQMNAEEDYKLLDFGIGFTNMVERATKGSADLTRKEIKEGCRLLQDKLRRFRPKIAVFNGKLIFEVFSGKKDFNFGRQPECIEGTNTYMWVMPSSSARCAQLPRAADKVPFYTALKKFRDYLNGLIPHLDESECVFTDPKFKACYEIEPKADNLSIPSIQTPADITDLSNNHKMLDVPGKKKRGRPKKVRGLDGEEPKVTPRRAPSVVTLDSDGMPKKKRGRPKKIKSDSLNGMSNGMEAISNSIDAMCNTNLGMCSNINGQNRMYPSPMQSPNPNNTFCGMNNLNPGGTYGSINSMSMHPNRPNSYNHQQSPQNLHSQPFSHSDLSSEISAAISSEHLGESPVPTSPSLGPPDFEPPNNCMPPDDNNTNECGFASPAPSTISEHNGSALSQLHSSNNSTSYSPYRTTPNNSFMDPRSNDPNVNSANDNYAMQQRQQNGIANSLLRQSISANIDQQHSPQQPQQQQQQQQQHQQQQHSTPGDVYKLPDVSAKSLSGLESLVDQIPSLNDSESASSNSSLVGHTLNVNNLTGTSAPISDSRSVDPSALGDQYQNSCIYSGYPTNLNSMPGPTTVNPSQIPQYSNSNYTPPNSSSQSNATNAYGSLSSSFSVSSLTSSYPSSVSMNSYHSNLMAASTHHLGGTGAPMYMEPHIPMAVNPLYHPYSQHASYTGYSPIAPPPTIHMPSPNYPYGYTNSSYGQPAHPTTHPAAGYLSNHHHSMFDRIKPDIGYGGF